MAYQAQALYRAAESEYRIAHKLNPDAPGPWLGLASNYLEEVEAGAETVVAATFVSAALEAASEAIRLDPGVAFAHYLLGVAYYRSALPDKAEASLTRALELDSTLAAAHLALVNVYIRIQDWDRALAHIDRYIKDNPRAPNRDQVLAKRSEIERMTAG
jgi:tetratricopeptide (TPR) repeat protein